MTGEVIPFKSPTSRHTSGAAVCIGCKHEWEAVVPNGTTSLECPACGTFKGVFKYPYAPVGDCLVCTGCDGALFYVTAKGTAFCPTCGVHLNY